MLSIVDPTLTLSNVIEALEDMPVANLRAFAVLLNIPWPKVKKVFSRFSTSTERKNEIVRIYLTQHPHPAWIHISDALYQFGGVFNNEQYHTVLMKIRSMYPTGQCVCVCVCVFHTYPCLSWSSVAVYMYLTSLVDYL